MTDGDTDVYTRLGVLETEVKGIRTALAGYDTILNDIKDSLHKRGDFDAMRVLKFLTLAAGLIVVCASAITYVATQVYAPRLALVEFKTEQVWRTGHWVPNASWKPKLEQTQ